MSVYNSIYNKINTIKIYYTKIHIKLIYIINLLNIIHTNIKNYYYFFRSIYLQNKDQNKFIYQEYKNLYNNLYYELENKKFLVKNTKIKFDNCYLGILLNNNDNNIIVNDNNFKNKIKKFKKKIKKIKDKNINKLSNFEFNKDEINYILFDRIFILPIDTYFNKNKNYNIYIYHINDIFIYGIYKKSFYDYFLGYLLTLMYIIIYYSFFIYAIYKYYITIIDYYNL